jgi:hypothetical protein
MATLKGQHKLWDVHHPQGSVTFELREVVSTVTIQVDNVENSQVYQLNKHLLDIEPAVIVKQGQKTIRRTSHVGSQV